MPIETPDLTASPTVFSFGVALGALKSRSLVSRQGWNGKGMYLFYVPQDGYFITKMSGIPDHSGFTNRDFIAMKTVDNQIVPWLASQSDLLAEDWMIVEL